jgi:acyl-CoA thioesterase FadM
VFPWLRLIRVGSSLIDKSKVDLLATTRVYLRVWPNDLDFNIHVNNGRYLALADIGRMHWFVRTGVLGVTRQQKAFPVIGDAIAKFRHDLKVFRPSRFIRA